MSEPPSTTRRVGAGSAVVAVGLGVYGLAGFVHLGLAGRELGPQAYAPLAVAWTVVNAVGGGVFVPMEQEVARLAARRHARGEAAPRLGHVLRYVATALTATGLVALVGGGWLADVLLAGDRSMVWVTAGALGAQAVAYVARGALSGTGRFTCYGGQLAVDGAVRVACSAALFATGSGTSLRYGLVLVAAPLVATLVTTAPASVRWLRAGPTPEPATPLGGIVGTWVAAQLLANAGPLAVAALATPSEQAAAGTFVAAVTIARVPVMAFSALQAVFLPTLAGLVGADEQARFSRTLRLALTATVGLGVAGTLGVALLGPWLLRLVYGPGFAVPLPDLVLLAVSGALLMVAQTLAQALLAHRDDVVVLAGWLLGLAVLAATLLAPLGLTTLAATALCTGTGAAGVCHAVLLGRRLSRWQAEVAHA